MIADNPGTWLFECHVSDHMEAGMMVTYTIYSPPRSCPVTLLPDDWNKLAGTSAIRVRNSSAKPIRQVSIMSGYLESVLDLEPLILAWFSPGPLPSGQEQTVPIGSELFSDGTNLGVAFYPSRIVYQDGSEWKPRQLGDCFKIYWRDKEHPRLPVLPPSQLGHKDED
jgi:hypothetical protein